MLKLWKKGKKKKAEEEREEEGGVEERERGRKKQKEKEKERGTKKATKVQPSLTLIFFFFQKVFKNMALVQLKKIYGTCFENIYI